MATNYPSGIDSLTNPSAGDALTSPSHSAQHANANDAIEAIETELGTTPSGSESTVAARLTAIESGARMGTGSIGATALADNAVDTAAIQDGAVTPAKLATSGRFTFPTGAANGYGFTSGASHLSGTGTPEGVITAAPGSTWLQTDATTDVKGWLRWIKATGTGNTGWVAGPEADTGWRDVTASLDATFKTARPTAALYLRRVGSQCEARYIDSGSPSSVSGLIYDMPTGFWGSSFAKAVATMVNASTLAPTTASMLVTYTSGQWLYAGGWGAAPYFGSVTWMTTQDWPASLPGSAA